MDIRIEGLTKEFAKVKAVDHLNLHIADGELVGLLGPSGCGKSTTLFMLAGLLEPTKGRIFFGDTEVTGLSTEKREIGLVFQNYALYPHMTVLQNIMFPLENKKVKKQEAKERAIEMARLVQIEALLNRKPKELSGGQQQRVAIARALVKKPQVLLLDEPLSNLDAKLRVETREEIRRIQQEVGITTVFVTHDQEEAMSISDRIAIMEKGVLQQYEKPQDMYRKPCNEFVARFLGTPSINMLHAESKNHRIICGDTVLREKIDSKEGTLYIGVRPESFMLSEEGFDIAVKRVQMTGRDLLICFDLGGQEVRALIDSGKIIEVGQTLKVLIKPGQIICFDEETGKTVGEF